MKYIGKILKVFFLLVGSLFLVFLVLAFTTLPFHAWYRLSTSEAGISRPPDYIVIMGGGGMPSETGLIRTWYGAGAAGYFSRSMVIIALPGKQNDSLSSISRMKKELILRGIAPERILLEDSGTNTRAQAVNIKKLITDYELRIPVQSSIVNRQSSIAIVTSPEHLCRAVRSFKKAGFHRVDGLPAFEAAIESGLTFNAEKLGGKKWLPDVGENLSLRYEFWTQLKYEQLVIREYLAITYYWMMGWI